MKFRMKAVAGVAVVALGALGLAACGSDSAAEDGKSLVIWNYEDPNSAMGQAWAAAVEIFKERHPDVDVEFTKQSFSSSKNNAKVILTGEDVPDVMEYTSGAADTGQLAALGLIVPLNDAVEQYGWEDILDTDNMQVLARYNEEGVPGSGDWYGIPNYGEYTLWYYNKEYFAEHGLEVPQTRAEFEDLLVTIAAIGDTPIAASAKEFPIIHEWFQFILQDAPDGWVRDYQLFEGPVDFDAPYWLDGTRELARYVEEGYVDGNITGVDHEQMGVNFLSQNNPLMMSGSWWFGRIAQEASFDWGTFLAPEQNLVQGAVGNPWVVPTNAKNKELAYEFIDITLSPEIQNLFGELGGLPIAGDPAAIADERTRQFTEDFQTLADADKLAFYPDFPVPGFGDFLVSSGQSLINGSKTPEELVAGVRDFYEAGRAELEG